MSARFFKAIQSKSFLKMKPSTALFVGLSTLVLITPALASLKSLMEEMGATNKVARSLTSGNFDSAKAIEILKNLADQSDQSIKATPANAGGKDMNKRFVAFSAAARQAAAPGLDKEKFNAVYADLVSQCKGCHTSYRN